ncbi:uncharacterized protein B0T15DRAFT_484835 [Chaetomium strumarium]|uniref:Uncharacterized protein n=1 Tax=Chaetomium strumarium TaxID=1170767 RepID=A0AAJ0GS29_9PEZI|nr:hypothetical protein B0T15DRAFT_484835 [Chaetomium strumarium]
MPAGEIQGIYKFKELVLEKHLLGQSVVDIAGGKRRRDGDIGEYIALAAKRTKVDGDRECLAAAARRIESNGDGECPALPIKRKRAAKHNMACKKELSPVVIFDTDSDLYKDIIICVSAIDKHIALDPDFLKYIDPALLAL